MIEPVINLLEIRELKDTPTAKMAMRALNLCKEVYKFLTIYSYIMCCHI